MTKFCIISLEDKVYNFKLVWMIYQGFVISDWQGLDRITSPPHSNYTYSVLAGVQAGIDMVLYLSFCGEIFTPFHYNWFSYFH